MRAFGEEQVHANLLPPAPPHCYVRGANYSHNATATGLNAIEAVELISADNPVQGFWKVRVRGTAVPFGPHNYALVANTSFSLSDQPGIRVNAALDFDDLCPGDQGMS
jgi:hypothetical protein